MSEPAARMPKVWGTAIDPFETDGRAAIDDWVHGRTAVLPIARSAAPGDLVLAWISRGTGFQYLLQISGESFSSSAADMPSFRLALAAVIKPALTAEQLQPAKLREWLTSRISPVEWNLSDDEQWPDLVRILEEVAPDAVKRLDELMQLRPSEPGGVQRKPEAVQITDDGTTEIVAITVTPELGDLMARAAAISPDSIYLSFSSLMLATLHGSDPLGRWLRDYFASRKVNAAHLLPRVQRSEAEVRRLAQGSSASQLTRPLHRTLSARRAFDEAAAMAQAQGTVLGTSHLMLGLIGLNNYHEADFVQLRLDRAHCASAFLQHLARSSSQAEMELWKQHYRQRFGRDPMPVTDTGARIGRRPDYDADAYTTRDLLSIDDEVAALAYVIASKQTTPPLAIGLFGEWGSGKTFFMNHLRRQIDRLAQGAAQQPAERRACHARIAQIEFNAWHYQEGDLWASLVDHILRNLRFGEDEEDAKVTERRQQLLRELEEKQARQQVAAEHTTQADSRIVQAEARVAELKTEEQSKREQLTRALASKPALQAIRKGTQLDGQTVEQGRQLLRSLNIDLLADSAEEMRDALAGARRELSSVLAFAVPLLRAEDRGARALRLAAVLLLPVAAGIAITLLTTQQELLARIGGWATSLLALAGMANRWIRSQTAWVRNVREQVSRVAHQVNQEFDQAVEQELTEQKKAVTSAMLALDSVRQDRERAQAERDEAAAQADGIKQRLTALDDEGRMRAFLDARIGGGTYQQKLGTAALVRRDFEALSRKIVDVTTRESQNKLNAGELVINRIVLYIDDLDRCEMDKVVPVLRAVHLLLAFKAFVVIVGVDSRWVAHCLEHHHQAIFESFTEDEDRQVTPLDYLEKIFQIPIWLEPVDAAGRSAMVRELLRPGALPAVPEPKQDSKAPHVQRETVVSAPPSPAEASGEARPEARRDRPARRRTAQTVPSRSRTDDALHAALDLNPRGLEISDAELAFIEALSPLLSSSPRVLKRFVNTYRLINATLVGSDDETGQNPTDAEIRMMLLAVLVGMPELSFTLQGTLRESSLCSDELFVETMHGQLHYPEPAKLAEAARRRERTEQQWASVKEWIDARGSAWQQLPAARVARWIDPVGRYTFNLTRASKFRGASPSVAPREDVTPASDRSR